MEHAVVVAESKVVDVDALPLAEVVGGLSPNRSLHLEVLGDPSAAAAELAKQDGIAEANVEGSAISASFEGSNDQLAAVLASLVTAGVQVTAFYEKKVDVQDVFLRIGAKEVS